MIPIILKVISTNKKELIKYCSKAEEVPSRRQAIHEAIDKLENQDGLYTTEDVEQIEKQVREQVDTSYKTRINKGVPRCKI